ncbi:MAG: FHA domain-containing protein [Tannerella sp.]|jgi:uncharacterized Zn finger protein (UPF0148 family)|nr:FHA domain-containing protein [Tannerella sp.]
MRCKNCGWDNPHGNTKCEKCNAPIDYFSENERTDQQNYDVDDYTHHPMPPIPPTAGDEMNPRATFVGSDLPNSSYNPQATVRGCSACGYPIVQGTTECPVCGHKVAGAVKAPVVEKPQEKKHAPVGTLIQGAVPEKEKEKETEKTDSERKKLTGFLVSYSRLPNGAYFPLYEGKNTIGRSASSNVCIRNDSAVSERHLSILYRAADRKFKFKDEQSSNGTFINNELLDEGELKNFDMIRIGDTSLLFIAIPLAAFE